MVGKTWALCAAALLQFNTALAVPVGQEVKLPVLRRDNITVTPPTDVTPIVTEITEMTKQELQELIEEVENGIGGLISRTEPVTPRAVDLVPRAQGTEGALLTFIDGDILPGTDTRCTDFEVSGPFTTFQAFMGSSNFRAVAVTSISGNASEIRAGDTLVDGGEFKFAQNERMTKFSVGRVGTGLSPVAISFETDAGNTYSAASEITNDNTVTWEELSVGSGVLARIRGANCNDAALGIIGSIGFDFIDTIDSVSISNIDYEGFTDNIMPTGAGTQMSVGSQILDNRNSSEKQTITLITTDAITRQSTVSTDLWISTGGSVSIEATAGIPLVGDTKVNTAANWNIQTNTGTTEMSNSITTRSGTFALACPAGKFCTAKAFFTQYKLDVNMNATMMATTQAGDTFTWVQSGTYKGADSLAMQFNVTEVSNVS